MMRESNNPHNAPHGPSEGQHPPGTLRAGEMTGARQRASEAQQRAIAELQDSIDCLRVAVKAMAHDLEATRRERDYLRRLLAEGE